MPVRNREYDRSAAGRKEVRLPEEKKGICRRKRKALAEGKEEHLPEEICLRRNL